VVFFVDDLVSWLVGQLADAGYQKVSTRLFGSEQDRALKKAVTAAVLATAAEFSPSDEEEVGRLAARISGAFGKTVQLPPGLTRLEALRAGVTGQLTGLDDAGLTATGQPLSSVLTSHLVREIVLLGSRDGPLTPRAARRRRCAGSGR
jgi:hypothetical protein